MEIRIDLLICKNGAGRKSNRSETDKEFAKMETKYVMIEHHGKEQKLRYTLFLFYPKLM